MKPLSKRSNIYEKMQHATVLFFQKYKEKYQRFYDKTLNLEHFCQKCKKKCPQYQPKCVTRKFSSKIVKEKRYKIYIKKCNTRYFFTGTAR